MRLLLIAMLIVLGAPARAEPLGVEVEALVRKELGAHLTRPEVDKLLRDVRVRDALAQLFRGWDGEGDELRVARVDGEIMLATLVRERICVARLQRGPEALELAPICEERVAEGGERRLLLEDDLWKKRAPRPKPAPEPRVADVAPKPDVAPQTDPAAPTGPVENTVLRRKPGLGAVEVGPVMEAQAQHEQLKAKLRRPHYLDPMLPGDAVEAGEALRPLEVPAPVPEARADTHLRDPFDPARLRTQDPVPDMLTLPNDPTGMPLLPELNEECVDEWRLKNATPNAPTLDCYRRVAWHDRLEDNDAYQALSRIAAVLQIPLLQDLVAMMQREATSHQAHRLAWALMWIAWVKEHPDRTDEALAGLTPEERRFVRRRLADWWVEGRLAELRPTITRLFERHILGLYPEATDLDGLPRRSFVTDTWLWANNWLAILDARSNDAIAAAYERLSQPERRVIKAFVRDRDLSRRWSRAADVLASL